MSRILHAEGYRTAQYQKANQLVKKAWSRVLKEGAFICWEDVPLNRMPDPNTIAGLAYFAAQDLYKHAFRILHRTV